MWIVKVVPFLNSTPDACSTALPSNTRRPDGSTILLKLPNGVGALLGRPPSVRSGRRRWPLALASLPISLRRKFGRGRGRGAVDGILGISKLESSFSSCFIVDDGGPDVSAEMRAFSLSLACSRGGNLAAAISRVRALMPAKPPAGMLDLRGAFGPPAWAAAGSSPINHQGNSRQPAARATRAPAPCA